MPLARDITALYRLLPQLLADGHEGRHAVVVDGLLRGVFDTHEDAYEAGLAIAGLDRHFLAQPVDARDLQRLADYIPTPTAVPA